MQLREILVLLVITLVVTGLYLRFAYAHEKVDTGLLILEEGSDYCTSTINLTWRETIEIDRRENIYRNMLWAINRETLREDVRLFNVDFDAYSKFSIFIPIDCETAGSYLESVVLRRARHSTIHKIGEADLGGSSATYSMTPPSRSDLVAFRPELTNITLLEALRIRSGGLQFSDCLVRLNFEILEGDIGEQFTEVGLFANDIENFSKIFDFPILVTPNTGRSSNVLGEPEWNHLYLLFWDQCDNRGNLTTKLIKWTDKLTNIPRYGLRYRVETEAEDLEAGFLFALGATQTYVPSGE